MQIEPEVDKAGMLEIYKKMLLIGIFQTDYGRWASNLPLHIKVLMAAMLVILLTAIASGIYFATVSWDRTTNWTDETYQNLLESVTPFLDSFTQEEEEESHSKIKTEREMFSNYYLALHTVKILNSLHQIDKFKKKKD